MSEVKTEAQILQEKLFQKTENAWSKSSEDIRKSAFEFCEGYKRFIDCAKTEREFASEAEKAAVKNGFISIDEVVGSNMKLTPGMKVYQVDQKKSVILAVIGSRPVVDGVNIIGAHIDSPRIDLKQNPVYEELDMALLKTHYYGNVLKHQWLSIPLAIHGVIVKKNGECVNIVIGEDESDPIFTIADLGSDFYDEKQDKKLSEMITGEELNIIFGSIPYADERINEKVKMNVLSILNHKYGIVEGDFQSAELELVPAFKARDVGLDRGLIGANGQDDRACAYPAFIAMLETPNPVKTSICLLSDKEEVGSAGAEAILLEDFLSHLCAYTSENYNDTMLRRCMRKSRMLSADVNSPIDPSFNYTHDSKNATYMGKGFYIQKYNGSGGKYESNDANAEFIAELRSLLDESCILWQTGELAKVDYGGGGTIAKGFAKYGINVIDCGVSLLAMHSPLEISSKIDIYYSYKAYSAFYSSNM